MIRSMTAFGRAIESVNGKNITVEIKSVNNRYFDCSVKISRNFSFLEEKIKPYLQEKGISRGKVDVNITIEQQNQNAVDISLNEQYAEGYIKALKDLKKKFNLKGEISVMEVAKNKDVFNFISVSENEEDDFNDLKIVLDSAIEKFLNAREAEGNNIGSDISSKIVGISKMVDQIEKLSENDITSYRSKLEERLRQVLSDNKVTADENRILTECAIFADRIAIDEEIVRLRSHFKAFGTILNANEPSGRKLDFLMQEMNRETNTIGSKCSNSEIAHIVVDIKTELEKVREQIQNIE